MQTFVAISDSASQLERGADARHPHPIDTHEMRQGILTICFITARAVQTSMLAAHMTRRLNLLAGWLTGAVQPGVQVVQRKADHRRRVLRGCAVEIHALEQVAILFRQAGQKPLKALAQDPFGGELRASL